MKIKLKHYVVITKGGFSQDDAGNDTENCQLIGIYSAEDSSKALSQAINDNKERGHSFNEDDLIIYETTNIKRL
jgi:hypothetical protein